MEEGALSNNSKFLNRRQDDLEQSFMSRKVFGDFSNQFTKINNENKEKSEDSTIDRLIQQKKNLLQQHSHQVLYREQKIKSLQNQISIKGIEYDRLKSSYDELIDNAKIQVDQIRQENDALIERINQLQVGKYLDKLEQILFGQKSLSIISHSKENSINLSQSQFPEWNMIDQLQKVWHQNISKIQQQQKVIKTSSFQLSCKQSQNKLLKQHLDQAVINIKKQKLFISSLQKIIETSESQKSKTLKQFKLLSSPLNIQSLQQQQLKKLISQFLIKQKQYQKKTSRLQQELYLAKQQSTSKFQSMMQRMSKLKEQKDNEIGKLKVMISNLSK